MAPVKYNNLDISKIKVSKLEDNERVQSQKLSYVRYGEGDKTDQFMLQTPEIILNTYGIPKHHDKWYPSDDKRSFIKVPLYDNKDESKILKQKLMEIDALYGSDDFRKKTFGDKFADKYEYIPLVREPQETEDDDESSNNKKKDKIKLDEPKPWYIKVKLDTEWQTNKLLTKVFVKSSEGRQEVSEDELTCIDDLLQLVNWKSTIRMILMFNKFYAMKNAPGGAKKKYGFTIKVKQLEVQPYVISKKVNNVNDYFLDDDDDLELLMKSNKNTIKLDENKQKVITDDNLNKSAKSKTIESKTIETKSNLTKKLDEQVIQYEDEEVEEEVEEVEEEVEEVEDEEVEEIKQVIVEAPKKKDTKAKSKTTTK